MKATDTERVPRTAHARTRLPRVAEIFLGAAVLTGIVLLWIGPLADRSSSERSARGATVPASRNRNPSHPLIAPAADLPRDAGQVSNEPRDNSSAIATPTAVTAPEVPDFGRAILGTWTQYSHGHRTLHVQKGGKATIDVKLDGLSAIAFGEKLHLDIEWLLDGRALRFKTTGGTPESSVNAVKSLYGDNRVYEILEIDEKQMLLKEGDEEKTPWERVTDE